MHPTVIRFDARNFCGARNDYARRATWQSFSGSRRGRPCLACHGCCVNAVVGSPALWQPQVRPAPARHATRLGGDVLGCSIGKRVQVELAASPRKTCVSSYVFCSTQHPATPGRWAGCPFVGPIRGCDKNRRLNNGVNAVTKENPKPPPASVGQRRDTWLTDPARPPAPPNPHRNK